MAKFRQYNIQLLPLNSRTTEEVGIEGYKRFFDLFKEKTSEAYKQKQMAGMAKPLINDTYICPFVIHTTNEFAFGSFLKFHKAETVTEFYTQERLFEAPQGTTAVSNTHYFRFVFDFDYHRFAVEEKNGRLPGADVMMDTLDHFLRRIADHAFPHHTLTINLISDESSLNDVLAEGNQFGPVHVKIAFPNSKRLTETLRELKDINAHSMEANVSPARGARMLGLPNYIRDLIKNAATYGEAKITYFRECADDASSKIRRFIYSTSKHPRWVSLRQRKNEEDFEFVRRVCRSIRLRAQRESE